MPAAREFAQFGIRVMTIAPGIFHTPMLDGLPEDAQKSLGASVPFPPRLGRPEEYADLALFIVRNGYMNGETIRIDGALRMAPGNSGKRTTTRRPREGGDPELLAMGPRFRGGERIKGSGLQTMLSNSRSVRIEWGDCDPAGIIFYPRYFAMFDHSVTMLITAASGVSKAELLKRYDFDGYPLVATQAKFITPNPLRRRRDHPVDLYARGPVELRDQAPYPEEQSGRGRGPGNPRLGEA